MGIIIDDGGSFRPRPRYARLYPLREGPRPKLRRRDRFWRWTHRWRRPSWGDLQRELLAAVDPKALAYAYARADAVDPTHAALVLVRDHQAWTTGTLQAALAALPSMLGLVLERIGEAGERIMLAEPTGADGPAVGRGGGTQLAAAREIVATATTRWPVIPVDVNAWLQSVAALSPPLQAAVRWPDAAGSEAWSDIVADHLNEADVLKLLVAPGSPPLFLEHFWTGLTPHQRWAALARPGVWARVAASGRGAQPLTEARGIEAGVPEWCGTTTGGEESLRHPRRFSDLRVTEQLRDEIWNFVLRNIERQDEEGLLPASAAPSSSYGMQRAQIQRRWQEDLRQIVVFDRLCGHQIAPLVCDGRSQDEWSTLARRIRVRGQYLRKPIPSSVEPLGDSDERPGAITSAEIAGWQWLLTHCPASAVPLLWSDLWFDDHDVAQILGALPDATIRVLGLDTGDVARLLRHEQRVVRLFAMRVLALAAPPTRKSEVPESAHAGVRD